MTLLMIQNLGLAWGTIAGPAFNPAWATNSNQLVGPIAPQPVTK